MVAKLILIKDDKPIDQIAVGTKPLTIGRKSECDIPIKDPAVSGNHARIFVKSGFFVIEDLGSTNGIHVRGEKVQKHKLENGDEINIGEHRLKFMMPQTGGKPAAAAAQPKPASKPAPEPAQPAQPAAPQQQVQTTARPAPPALAIIPEEPATATTPADPVTQITVPPAAEVTVAAEVAEATLEQQKPEPDSKPQNHALRFKCQTR